MLNITVHLGFHASDADAVSRAVSGIIGREASANRRQADDGSGRVGFRDSGMPATRQ